MQIIQVAENLLIELHPDDADRPPHLRIKDEHGEVAVYPDEVRKLAGALADAGVKLVELALGGEHE